MTKKVRNAEPCESIGQTWFLSKVDPTIRETFAARVLARAIRRLNPLKALLSEDEFKARKEDLDDQIAAGIYDWGPPVELGGTGPGRAIHAYFNLGQGNIELLQFLLLEEHGELSLERVQEILDGNLEGVQAAFRAAHGLPPLAVAPPPAEAANRSEETTPQPAVGAA